jgi:23S rRNA pseudouridine1911/1915/1917 synthase
VRTVAAGHLRINGRTALAGDLLRPGDRLEYHREPWSEPEAPLEFAVHFEDQDVLVVAKQAGLQVLPAGPFLEHTLLHQVRASDPSRAASSPVHRLGRGTSGLILFGKSERARAELSRQFRAFEPRKTYLAWVEGTDLPTGVIARHPIGPVPHGLLQLHVALPTGKPAKTRVRVLRRAAGTRRALVAAQPITGRPDQIRVHLAALGAPIVGDPLFGAGGLPKSDAPPGTGGYLLHAAALSFRHPLDGHWIRCRSFPDWLDGR